MNMVQRKFYFPVEMYNRLQLLARTKKQTITETLRTVVARGLELEQQHSGNAHVLLEIARHAEQEGWGSGVSDLAENHDKYFVEAYEEAEEAKQFREV